MPSHSDEQTSLQGAVAVGRPKMLRRRDGTAVTLVDEGDGVIRLYEVRLVPTTPYVPAIDRLEAERCAIFGRLAPIVGADALASLLEGFDAALADLKRERETL